jgi:microcystin-dependent protein
MKRNLITHLFILGFSLSPLQIFAQENIPKLINYQGKLTDAGGQALADGAYMLRFSLYSKSDSAQPGDSLVWGMEYNVTVISGQFNVVLGASGGTPVPGAAVNDIGFAFTAAERYVQLTVLTDNTGANLPTPQVLLPRQQLLSVPYALNGTPAGAILPYAGTIAPPGYLMCDGRSHNKGDYPALAAVLNTATGAAFGGTAGANGTFNVPDLRGRFLRGADDPDGSGAQFTSAGRDPDNQTSSNNGADGRRYANATGGNVGNAVGSVQNHAMLSHLHSVNISGTTSHQGDHAHGIGMMRDGDHTAGIAIPEMGSGAQQTTGATTPAGAHSHTFTVLGNTASAGTSTETRPANAYVNFIIKF